MMGIQVLPKHSVNSTTEQFTNIAALSGLSTFSLHSYNFMVKAVDMPDSSTFSQKGAAINTGLSCFVITDNHPFRHLELTL